MDASDSILHTIRHEIWQQKLMWKHFFNKDHFQFKSGLQIGLYLERHMGRRAVVIRLKDKIVAIHYFGMDRGIMKGPLVGVWGTHKSLIGFVTK